MWQKPNFVNYKFARVIDLTSIHFKMLLFNSIWVLTSTAEQFFDLSGLTKNNFDKGRLDDVINQIKLWALCFKCILKPFLLNPVTNIFNQT